MTVAVFARFQTLLILNIGEYQNFTKLLMIFVEFRSNMGEIHYHKENKTNGAKQIEFSGESNQF